MDPGYKSPYPKESLRHLEAYYFPNWDKLYVPDPKTKEIDTSYMRMYEKGQTVTSFTFEQLAKDYPLSAANLQTKIPKGTTEPTTPAKPANLTQV